MKLVPVKVCRVEESNGVVILVSPNKHAFVLVLQAVKVSESNVITYLRLWFFEQWLLDAFGVQRPVSMLANSLLGI
jgi:hypothetical protein